MLTERWKHVAFALGGIQHLCQHRVRELGYRTKNVVVRPSIIIPVGPNPDSRMRVPLGLGRQRCPAHMLRAVAPADPGGSPFKIRHPTPTGALDPDPAAVMVNNPTEVLFAHPCPTETGIGPGAHCIRRPAVSHPCRPPTTPKLPDLKPLTVRFERLGKNRRPSRLQKPQGEA
jgi:hypothetical protein